eukprot:scaffold8369_cov121-Cylindrotheca_fusiformis.AAC.2
MVKTRSLPAAIAILLCVLQSVGSTRVQVDEIDDAVALLASLGVPEENLCSVSGDDLLPSCSDSSSSSATFDLRWLMRSRQHRYLEEDVPLEEDTWSLVSNALCALACVTVAALAAGLTMGLLSLDPLMLLIKIRAGNTEAEKKQAASLLPIVKQHHLLLVTLLLLNSMANEALPLFLEALVSPLVSVILSVTLVLFGGEIIPSAIFTGPNKIKLASQLTPLVRLVMLLLWPIAYPISKVLDHLLHDNEGEEVDAFNRRELSALVRIQYEERMASKRQHKKECAKIRKSKNLQPVVNNNKRRESSVRFGPRASNASTITGTQSPVHRNSQRASIHIDEVSMVEGALQMKTKKALDVYTPLRKMYAIPIDTVLDEETVVDIYSSGYSRIPVFEPNPNKPKMKSGIRGILMTKQLIVLNPSDCRPLVTLPLHTPTCVSPVINLVDLLNILQTGRSGHLALVCARPSVAEACLMVGEAVPERAGFMGIITIEDVLEELLQEEIADEYDRREWREEKLSEWVITKWKKFADSRRKERQAKEAIDQANMDKAEAGESTRLLGGEKKENKVFFGIF